MGGLPGYDEWKTRSDRDDAEMHGNYDEADRPDDDGIVGLLKAIRGEQADPLELGTWTRFGRVGAVAYIGGERYYFLEQFRFGRKTADVSLMPADVVEADAEVPF